MSRPGRRSGAAAAGSAHQARAGDLRQREGADQRGQQQDGEELERPHPGPEDRGGHGLGVAVRRLQRALADERDEHHGEQDGDRHGEHRGEQPLPPRAGDVAVRADRRAREHQREEHEHDDRADVDEHLDQGHQLGAEDHVAAGDGAEAHDQPEGGVDDVAGRHGEDGAHRRDEADDGEDDVAGGHDSASPSVARLWAPAPAPPTWPFARSAARVARGARRRGAARSRRPPRQARPTRRRAPAAAAPSASTGRGAPSRGAGRGCRSRRTRTRGSSAARRRGIPRCRCCSTCTARSRWRTGRARCAVARGRPRWSPAASPCASRCRCTSRGTRARRACTTCSSPR